MDAKHNSRLTKFMHFSNRLCFYGIGLIGGFFLGAYRKTSTRFCRLLGCNTQVLKKNKRVLANSFIVFIDRTPVFWFTAHLGFANSGQNGTQDLFPKDHQRCDGADSLWWNRVSPGIGHFGQEVLGTQFFQVVGRSASIVKGIGRSSHRLDGGGELPSGESLGRTGQRHGGRQHGPYSGLVHVEATDSYLADLRWMGKFVQSRIAYEGCIHGVDVTEKLSQDLPKPGHDRGEAFQDSAAAKFLTIVNHHLDTKHAFAFGIDLQSQLTEMQFEDRQVILRSLDHDFQSRRFAMAVPIGTGFDAEDRFQLFDIQARPRSVDQPLKDLFHLATAAKDEIAAVLDLVDRVVVVKPAALLFLQVQPKTQTGAVDPSLADLTQPPYRPGFGQGVCDLRQVFRFGNKGEAVPLLGERNPGVAALAGYILMAIQNDLRTEGRMAGHLDGDVPPIGIHDVEGIVVNKDLFRFKVTDDAAARSLNLPAGGHCPADQDEKQAPRWIVLQMLFGDLMLALFTTAVDDRYTMSFSITTHPTAESSRHPHQVCVVQFLFRSVVQPPPPESKAARRVAQSKVGVQNNTVHAIVAAIEIIAVIVAEFIGIHGCYSTTAQLRSSTARRAIFSEHRLRKSVDTYELLNK